MKTGMLLHSGGPNSPAAQKNRLRKAFVGQIIWNSAKHGQAIRVDDAYINAPTQYRPASVNQKKRSEVMGRIRKQRDKRMMVLAGRKKRRGWEV